MAEDTNTSAEFIRYMSGASELGKILNTANDAGATKAEKDGARGSVVSRASELAKERRDIDEDLNPGDPEHVNYARTYLGKEQGHLMEQAADRFDSNLEGIIGSVEDSKLERIAAIEDVGRAAGSEYNEWLALYSNYQAAQDFVRRAKDGEDGLKGDEVKLLRSKYAEVRAQEAREGASNLSKDAQDDRAELAMAAVMIGAKKTDYEAGAKKYASDAEAKLREYEGANEGRNLKGFVTAGLKNLAKIDRAKTMNITYGAIKPE